MMNRRFLFLFFGMLFFPTAYSYARTPVVRNIFWFAWQEQVRLNQKLGLGFDAQIRRDNWGKSWFLWAVRPSVNYTFTSGLQVAAGGAFFAQFQNVGSSVFIRYERRIWQEAALLKKIKNVTLGFRIRTEQRFMQGIKNKEKTGAYDFVPRLRLRSEVSIPLKRLSEKLYFLAGDEFMLAFPNGVGIYDQNRAYTGLGWKFGPADVVLQYINTWQRRNDGSFENQHNIRILFRHQTGLQKTKNTTKG